MSPNAAVAPAGSRARSPDEAPVLQERALTPTEKPHVTNAEYGSGRLLLSLPNARHVLPPYALVQSSGIAVRVTEPLDDGYGWCSLWPLWACSGELLYAVSAGPYAILVGHRYPTIVSGRTAAVCAGVAFAISAVLNALAATLKDGGIWPSVFVTISIIGSIAAAIAAYRPTPGPRTIGFHQDDVPVRDHTSFDRRGTEDRGEPAPAPKTLRKVGFPDSEPTANVNTEPRPRATALPPPIMGNDRGSPQHFTTAPRTAHLPRSTAVDMPYSMPWTNPRVLLTAGLAMLMLTISLAMVADTFVLTDKSAVTTLGTHDDVVEDVAFSPDSRTLVSGGRDNVVRVWDLDSTQNVRILTGHTGSVQAVTFSPDGTLVASGSQDGTVRIWDAATGAHLRTLLGHTDTVTSVAFSPNGETVVTASLDKSVRIWNATSGEHTTIQDCQSHAPRSQRISISLDGKLLACDIDGSSVNVVDLATRAEVARLDNAGGALAFSPDSAILATGSGKDNDGTIKFWNPATARQAAPDLNVLSYTLVTSIAFNPKNGHLVTVDRSGQILYWNLTSGTRFQPWAKDQDFTTSARFSPDGSMIAYGSRDRTVRAWKL